MRCLLKAAALAAPVLASVRSFPPEDIPHALIKLDTSNVVEDVYIQETYFRLDILESNSPCGFGNITLDGNPLTQNEAGFGSGTLTSEHGNIVLAEWRFSCVEVDERYQEQMMDFTVIYIDENRVRNVGFIVQFQQVAPMTVSNVQGARSLVRLPGPGSALVEFDDEQNEPDLDTELAELDAMRLSLIELKNAIAIKESYIAETFDLEAEFREEASRISQCDSLKCIIKTLFESAKGMAHKLYGDKHDFPSDGPEFGRWPPHGHGKGDHGKKPHFPPHHGNHTHGNNTHPHPPPPFHRPHWRPPPHRYCPPPPHHGPPPPHHGRPDHHRPHGPPDHEHPPPFDHERPPPPHGPPGDGPPPSHGPPDHDHPPPFDHEGPPPHGPPRHDGPPPPHGPPEHEGPPPPHGPPDHEHPPFDHEGPPPPHGPPGHDGPTPHPGHPGGRPEWFDGDENPPFPLDVEATEQPMRIMEDDNGNPPPPPPPGGEGPPPPPPEGHRRPPPPPPGPHGHFRGMPHLPLWTRILATVIVLGFLISAIRTRCFLASREQLRQRRESRRQARMSRRQKCLEKRAARRAALKSKILDWARIIQDAWRGGRSIDEEEKEAVLRSMHLDRDADTDGEEDNLSTTMEQEIAQFRAVAGVVGDIVAAEEGRSRREMVQTECGRCAHHRAAPLPSPTSAFPDYASVDEALPAYDEGPADATFVADGMRYSPGSSMGSYTPDQSSTTGSDLDEHLGRKD